jgi:hypothetical protein
VPRRPHAGNHAFARDFQEWCPDTWHIINEQVTDRQIYAFARAFQEWCPDTWHNINERVTGRQADRQTDF